MNESNIFRPPSELFFDPPFWAFNGHIHTIAGSQLMRIRNIDVVRKEIPTPDNDFLELDLHIVNEEAPVVALFHGLEGSSERIYIRNLMHQLMQIGISSVALNFRGCGSRMNEARRFYHSGETEDYHTLFNWITNHLPDRLVYAVGFSLGANALIKYLAEYSQTTPVDKAVAVSPPYDLKAGSVAMHHGVNRIYEIRFLNTLRNKLEQKRKQYPDLPFFTGRSLYDFDDQITAPVHGFESADAYYEQCSSGSFLAAVKRPLLLIHSWQDPICPLSYAPFKVLDENPNIRYHFTEEGGHVGFIHKDGDWLNKLITYWLQTTTAKQ